MYRSNWFSHPIFIFVCSILALGTSLFLYIHWYIEVSEGLKAIIYRFNLDSGQVLAPQTWMVIMVLSILVGIILLGIFIIFVYNQKILQLYRLQHNFINNFTHELKTPATSLNLYLETFQQHELSRPEQLKYIGYMLSDVKRLSDNISRILNLAKIESKSYAQEFVWSNLVETVQRFLAQNRHLFANCRVTVHPCNPAAFCARINPYLFEILLMNVLNNAVAYNAAVPAVDIRFTARHNRLRIAFADNGIGFEAAEARKIFKKFYQVGRADDMSARGSGLGLYLVQHIARIHGGRMTAASAGKGKGAEFTLTLPAAQQV